MKPAEIAASVEARVAASRRAFYRENPRADSAWTTEDERRLTRLMSRGKTFHAAARTLGRTENALRARWAEMVRCRARHHSENRNGDHP